MKEYLSPLEAAEEPGISIHELQQHVMKGNVTLYAPNFLGEAEFALFRYETTHFFITPDESLPMGCGLWDHECCPNDCEHKSDTYTEFCGREADEDRSRGEIYYPRTLYKLNELIIKKEDLKALSKNQDKRTSSPEQDRIKLKKKQIKEAIEEVKSSLEQQEKIYKVIYHLKRKYRFNYQEIYEVIRPTCKEGRDPQQKRSWVSGQVKKDPKRVPISKS